MNNLFKFAFVATTAVLAPSASAQSVGTSRQFQNDNWANGTGEVVWVNGTDELCWRDASWTPLTANQRCDGEIVRPGSMPPISASSPKPFATDIGHVRNQAETLFDFDTAALRPAGKEKLDDLVANLTGASVEVIVATGYTDRIGSNKYNDRLSLRRAEAVGEYLASKGIDPKRIYAEGKGKRDTVTRNRCQQQDRTQLVACLAPDRRVEVEVVHAPYLPKE